MIRKISSFISALIILLSGAAAFVCAEAFFVYILRYLSELENKANLDVALWFLLFSAISSLILVASVETTVRVQKLSYK